MLHDLVLNNIRLKLLALCLAIVLWFAVVWEQKAEQDFPVRVVYTVPNGSVIKNASPATFAVRISGPRIMLASAAMKGMEARLDLSGAAPGKVVFTNLERTLSLPRDLCVVRVQPPTIEVVVEPRNQASRAKTPRSATERTR